MRSISTGFPGELTMGEEQLEAFPVVAYRYRESGTGRVIELLRYTLTAEERRRIAAGEDLAFRMPGQLMFHRIELWSDVLAYRDPPGEKS